MTNKKLIRLFILILLLLTGTNSYSDLLLCHHDNGTSRVVSREYHELVHRIKDYQKENHTSIHPDAMCHSCFDIPFHIRNVAILNSGISIKIKYVFKMSDDHSGGFVKIFPPTAKRYSDKIPDQSCISINKSIVLLI